MYMLDKDIELFSCFYDFQIRFWNYSDNVVFFVFYLITWSYLNNVFNYLIIPEQLYVVFNYLNNFT
jgi:hypothetical protein